MKLIFCILAMSGYLFGGDYQLNKVGEYGTDLYAGVYLQAGIAYCAAGNGGLDILETGDPMRRLGSVPLGGDATDVVVQNGFAYVASGADGLWVVDVSTPDQPRELAHLPLEGTVLSVSFSHDFIYATGSGHLYIIDVSDPSLPEVINPWKGVTFGFDVFVRAGIAYVADGYNGFRMFDVSNPTAVFELSQQHIVGHAWRVAVEGNLAAVGGGTGFALFDVAEPYAPILLSTHTLPRVLGLSLNDRQLLAAGSGTLVKLDLTNPMRPRRVASLATAELTLGIDVYEGFAFLAQARQGLQRIDFNADRPISTRFNQSGLASRLSLNGSIVHLAGVPALRIVDATHPDQPTLLADPGLNHATCVGTIGGNSLLGRQGEFNILTFDPAGNPTSMRSYSHEGTFHDLTVGDGRIWLADYDETGTSSLRSLKYKSGKQRLDGRLVLAGSGEGLWSGNGFLLVADGEMGLTVVDISDPDAPRVMGRCATPGSANHVAVEGQYAYVAAGEAGLCVVDLSDLTRPRLVGRVDTPGSALRLSIDDGLIYLADGPGGVRVFDLRHQTVPLVLAKSRQGVAVDVVANEGLIFTAGGRTGKLTIFRLQRDWPTDH